MRHKALITIAVATALLLVATTVKSGWLYLVASFLFALVILGFTSGRIALRGISVDREAPGEVFEGETLAARISITNDARLSRRLFEVDDFTFKPPRPRLVERLRERRRRVRELAESGSGGGTGYDGARRAEGVAVGVLKGRSSVRAEYTLEPEVRGVYPDARLELRSGGAFGASEARKKIRVGSPVTVFPRPDVIEGFPLKPSSGRAGEEHFEWSRKGIGQDYYGVREYVRGDPLRNIHWKSSARRGELIVKEYEEELRPPSALLLLLGPPGGGTFTENSLEDGLRAAATVIDYLAALGSPPGLVMPGAGSFEIGEPSSLRDSLRELAAYEPPERVSVEGGWASLEEAVFTMGESLYGGTSMAWVMNLSMEEAERLPPVMRGMPPGSLILVVEDSYRSGVSAEDIRDMRSAVSEISSGQHVHTYAVTAGTGIGRCLSEPLNTIES